MYTTCLFCHGDLGRNECIEHFPVGRRLAIDAAKGRLWVVCRKCERWNLTPLEERWEAIEEGERLFRNTRRRVSTDNIGLARLSEGLEIVRIGQPLRPEMAAWRYGDQFGRRYRKSLGHAALGLGIVGGYLVAGPLLGVLPLGIFQAYQLASSARNLYRSKRVRSTLRVPGGNIIELTDTRISSTIINWNSAQERWTLDLPTNLVKSPLLRPFTVRDAGDPREDFEFVTLTGAHATRAVRAILPFVNAGGGRRSDVADAVKAIERTPDAEQLLGKTARHHGRRTGAGRSTFARLGTLPPHVRLALEMSVHEESERRALEGELHLLEHEWRDAEEVAGIADRMFVPDEVTKRLTRLKGSRIP